MSSATPPASGLLAAFDDAGLRSLIEQFFRTSFNAIVVTSAQPGYPIVYANPAFCRMTGYPAAELKGQSPAILQGPRSNPAVIARMNTALQEGRDYYGATINYRKNGDAYPVEWNITPIRNAEGKVTHFISVQKDLTALRKMVARLKNSHMQMRDFLREVDDGRQLSEPDMRERWQDLTTELVDGARIYTPALRSDEQQSLFGESEFFEAGGELDGMLGEPLEHAGISAAEYAGQHRLSVSDIAELQTILEDTQRDLDLVSFSSSTQSAMLAVAANLQDLANAIFYLEDFVSISSVLGVLATHTRNNAEKALPDFLLETFKALLHDLSTWVQRVFIDQSAADIHELDASIISSAKQLLMFLP